MFIVKDKYHKYKAVGGTWTWVMCWMYIRNRNDDDWSLRLVGLALANATACELFIQQYVATVFGHKSIESQEILHQKYMFIAHVN